MTAENELSAAADAADADTSLYAQIEKISLGSEGRNVDAIQDAFVSWLRSRADEARS